MLQESGVYTRSWNSSGTDDDRGMINNTLYMIPEGMRPGFEPLYVFVATWNKMKYSDDSEVRTNLLPAFLCNTITSKFEHLGSVTRITRTCFRSCISR